MLGADGRPDIPEPTRMGEPIWLQPYPDSLLEGLPDRADGPEARYETKEAVGLAFVSGLQRMAPMQRAVLVLRDVLGYRAAEVAGMLDSSEAAVNSALQRARAAMEDAPARPEGAALPDSPAERDLLARFADAFESADVDALVALMTDDAWIRMPPEPYEYQGHEAIAEFVRTRSVWQPGVQRQTVATRANGQPAFGYYVRDAQTGIARAAGLMVLTLEGDQVCALTRFGDTGVFPFFGLPRTIPAHPQH